VSSKFPFKSKIFRLLFIAIIISLSLIAFHSTIVFAVTADDCLNKNISDLSQGDQDWCYNTCIPQLIAPIQTANATNQQNLNALQKQLSSISARISSFLNQLKKTQADINSREESMAYTKEIFNEKAADQYKFLRLYDPITPFLFAESASQAFQEIN